MGDNFAQRRGGRKRSSEDDDPSGKRQKNRDAAKKSREKKNGETQRLKEKNEELLRTNKQLLDKKQELENKLQTCIKEIRNHKNSGCQLPKDVIDIIELKTIEPECDEDFIPVGEVISPSITQNINFQQGSPSAPVKGLFSGSDFPPDFVPAGRTRNLSSNSRSSPSVSPPPQIGTTQYHPKPVSSPSWEHLHRHNMVGKDNRSVPSPAQTVPNMDAIYSVPSSSHNPNGFPDIDDAVQRAHRDSGVTEDQIDFLRDPSFPPSYNPVNPSQNLPSLGFSPSLSVSSETPIMQTDAVSAGQNSSLSKPGSQDSSTVSVNVGELLSRSISNFDASELTPNLMREFVQAAKVEERVEDNLNTQESAQGSSFGQTFSSEQNVEHGIDSYTFLESVQTQPPHKNNISLDMLLELAKDQELVTVQIHGKEYHFNYEALQVLVARLKQNKIPEAYVVDESQTSQAVIYGNSHEMISIDTQEQLAEFNGIMHQNQINQSMSGNVDANCYTQNIIIEPGSSDGSLSLSQLSAVYQSSQAIMSEPVQNDQLPLTVLSMMESSCSQQSTPSMVQMNSADYADNVKDLPSLSLTEDHSNIFEKKRRQYR